MSTIFFEYFFPKPTQTENTWTLKGHLLLFLTDSILLFSKSQSPVILQNFGSERPAGWKKGKEVTSSNLCHALVALSALWPVRTREQEKSPLENDMRRREAKFLAQLHSSQVKQSLCWKKTMHIFFPWSPCCSTEESTGWLQRPSVHPSLGI